MWGEPNNPTAKLYGLAKKMPRGQMAHGMDNYEMCGKIRVA